MRNFSFFSTSEGGEGAPGPFPAWLSGVMVLGDHSETISSHMAETMRPLDLAQPGQRQEHPCSQVAWLGQYHMATAIITAICHRHGSQ